MVRRACGGGGGIRERTGVAAAEQRGGAVPVTSQGGYIPEANRRCESRDVYNRRSLGVPGTTAVFTSSSTSTSGAAAAAASAAVVGRRR